MAHKILVVDDDPNALRLISYALHREGFDIIAAQSGPEALQAVLKDPVDLVILDVMMPQMDGYQVCQRLRENPNTARLPVIMLTAKSQLEDKVRGFKAGADDYVTKPVLPAELLARVRALLVRSNYLATPTQTNRAKTLAFLGAKGGVGTTTLAVNVAIALSERSKNVVLADMNLSAGAIAMQMGLKPTEAVQQIWSDVEKMPTGPNITKVLLPHSSGVKVFAALQRSEAAALTVPLERAQLILDGLQAQAEFLVVDAGACISPASLATLSKSDRICVVTDSDYLALDLVQQTLDMLHRLDTRGAVIDVVMVNRTRSATVVSKSEAEQRLNMRLAGFIIPAPEMCFQSNRNRVPIMISQPGNLTVEQIRELAQQMAG